MSNRKALILGAAIWLLILFGIYKILFPTTTYLKYGLLNRQGQFTIPPQFDLISETSDGSYFGQNYAYDDDWMVWYCCDYNRNDHLQACGKCKGDPPKRQYDPGLQEASWLVIDENEQEKQREDDQQFNLRGKIGALGYQDPQGKWLIRPHHWQAASKFSQGIAFVWVDGKPYGKWGIINTKGQYILKPTCAHIWPFKYGRAKCQVAFEETRFLFSNPEVPENLKYYPSE